MLPKIGASEWHVVTSSSFEERCTALVDWMVGNGLSINSATLIRITNPSSSDWDKAHPLVRENFQRIQASLTGAKLKIIETDLLHPAVNSVLRVDELFATDADSVVLDITTLPKRFSLFALQRLLGLSKVKNLLVAYTQAGSYPEIKLCGNPRPPIALQGYHRIESKHPSKRFVISVGYVALNVEELMDRARNAKLDFLFPFPPASPAFRRNWKLLSMLLPDDPSINTEVHNVYGMDAFEVCDMLTTWGENYDLNLIPLGPKPHALGMALACLNLEGSAELIYPQPRTYRHNYSEGIARDVAGNADIIAYCLKRKGKQLFR